MACLFVEPCQFNITDLWSTPLAYQGSGPFGDRVISSPLGAFRNLGVNAGVLFAGFWYKPDNVVTQTVMSFGDGASVQCTLQHVNLGGGLFQFRLINGTAGATLATSANTFADTYRYLEIKIVFGNSGSAELRVDYAGTPEFAVSGIDTTTTANNYANRIGLQGTLASNSKYSAMYVCDDSGSTHNTFLGPQRGGISLSTADGSFTAWTANTGTRFGAVDDPTTTDEDATYVSSSTPSDKVSFSGAACPVAPTAVLLSGRARRDDAGPRTSRLFLRNGAGTIVNAATETIPAAYLTYNYLYPVSPFTAALWTKAEFDASERGAELVS